MKYLILIVLSAFFLQGCKDIIAENISGKTPVILIPSNGQAVNENPVHFKWEAMEGATKYRLQVASPSFANISVYALDSVIAGTDFYFPLDSNSYELKITAMNAGYTSHVLDGVFFTVAVSPSSGGGSTVVLTSPSDSSYFRSTDDFESTLKWNDLASADFYEVYVKKGATFSSATLLKLYTNIYPPYVNIEELNIAGEGQYHWGVRAVNSETETALAKRRFFIDTTKPNMATIISPSSTVDPGNVTFVWSNTLNGIGDPGLVHAPVNSIVEVSENSEFTLNVRTESVVGTTAVISLTGIGTRFWRVRNVDNAGNSAAYSGTGQFTLL